MIAAMDSSTPAGSAKRADASASDTPASDAAASATSASDVRERFIRLADRELDRAYRLAGLLLGNGGEAEDAVGDALERAWAQLDNLRDHDRFQAWFDRIVVNACRDVLRRRGRVRFVALEADSSARSPDPFRGVLDGDEALRAIAGLPPEEREVVILHFWADLTLDAVAERLGVPPGTARSRLHRALSRLREAMAQAAEGAR